MESTDWHPERRALMAIINGKSIDEWDAEGTVIRGEDILMLFNSNPEPAMFTAPPGSRWERLLDTRFQTGVESEPVFLDGGSNYELIARSMAVFVENRSSGAPV
jgi:pullulanase/glycogen debranching enzyme